MTLFRDCLLPAAGCLLLIGCQLEADRHPPMRERQDEALRDPFGYSPTFDRGVSGRPWRDSDEDLQKEVDRVHNP
jgi:hypothetical protein